MGGTFVKQRFWLHSLTVTGLVTGLFLATLGPAAAQQINPNPICLTGAEPRPSFLGISGGNYNSITSSNCCTGTFGGLVHDLKGHQFVLSSNTVLARVSPSKGHFKAQVGEKIVQPGLVDTGCFQASGDGVATLTRWVPLNFGLNNNNSVDAAIARTKPGMFFPAGDILNIGPISATTVAPNALTFGAHVQKMGRTSCLTDGQIDAIDATGKVAYTSNSCRSIGVGTAQFSHQILVLSSSGAFATTSGGGSDSGALVLTEETCPRAVGMVFASTTNGIAVVNPINKVLSALKVALVGGCTNTGSSALVAEDQADVAGDDAGALARSIEMVRGVKNHHERELLKLDDVAGTAIGRADDAGQAAMLVMVKKDTPEVRAQIPAEIEGVPVKVIETGEFQAL
jgi:hypothetical protein